METEMTTAEEYLFDKLYRLQEMYDKLQEEHQQLIHDYECCALDLNVTRQQLYDATGT